MRSYGKDSNGKWVKITDPNYIYLATLAQTLRLEENESPIYGNYGIPSQQSIVSQIAPDYAVNRTQSQYAPYFSNLTVIRDTAIFEPTYNIFATFMNGAVVREIIT